MRTDLFPSFEVRGSNNIEKYSSYLKDNTESRVRRSFAVDCESQVTCVAATGVPKTTRSV